jgi:hypothetical protein
MGADLQLAATLSGLSLREGHRIDLDILARQWREFAGGLAAGSGVGPGEYNDALGARDLIADVIASVPAGRGRDIVELVEQADDQYRRATRVVDNPRRSVRADRWWWTRIPAGLGNFTETTR